MRYSGGLYPTIETWGDRLTRLLKKVLEWIYNLNALKQHGLNMELVWKAER